MNSVERVLTALRHGKPDKVPFAYGYIHPKVREAIIGEKIEDTNHYKVNWSPVFLPGEKLTNLNPDESTDARVARKLGLDALGFQIMTPMMPNLVPNGLGGYKIAGGLLRPDNFDAFRNGFPDYDDETLYAEAKEFVRKYKGEFALFCRIRLGFSPVLTSIGTAKCIEYVHTMPDFVKEVNEFHSEWMKGYLKNLMEIGFDFLWSFDDMADRNGPFFTKKELNDVFIPYLMKSAKEISIPWIFHSDGELSGVINELMQLGMNGLHPLEPGCMNLEKLKKEYGEKLCLVGNIDKDHLMVNGTDEEIDRYIKNCMDVLGTGGGYLIADSNQVPANASADRIVRISKAVHEYRNIY